MVSTRGAAVQLEGGLRLVYDEHGDVDGVPVVMLHPWASSRGCFDLLIPLLPPWIHVFAPDQRGFGDADKPSSGYAFDAYVSDVAGFLDAVGLDSAWLLGSSSGGYVAQQFAVDHPERTHGLVLVGAPRSLRGRTPFGTQLDQLTDPVDDASTRRLFGTFTFFQDVPQTYVDARLDDLTGLPAHVVREAFEGLVAATPPTETGQIRAPTLILWGGGEDLLPSGDAQELVALVPGSELVVYEETGHLVLWEQPQRIAQDVVRFLSSRGRPDPGRGST